MPAPSKPWVTIIDSQTDADSPLDATLVTALRDNLVHLEEWLGDGYTAAKDHDHDGVNSKKTSIVNLLRTDEIILFDDFLFDNLIGWTASAVSILSGMSNGVIQIANGGYLWQGAGKPLLMETNKTITLEMRIKLSAAAPDSAIYFIGFETSAGTQTSNRIVFTKNNLVTYQRWKCETANGGSVTTTETDINVSASYQTLKIVATTTAVTFYIDGVLKATHTTNIPIVNLGISLDCSSSGGLLQNDYILCYKNIR